MSCTIVIPTYNEAENLENLVEALRSQLIQDLKLLIVDDNSPDGTGRIADELATRYPLAIDVIHRKGKLGLGSAYIQGFQTSIESGAEAIGQMDADFSHSPSYIPQFLSMLDTCDAVVGSRYVPGGALDERWGMGRVFLSWFGNFYARTILRLPIRDTTGGFRIWKAETLAQMPLDRVRSSGYVFQVEMAYIAHRLGFQLKESPIYFEDRRIGQSKMSFQIQMEAAVRVWMLPFVYRDLQPLSKV